jgi:hypothetical protein
MIRTVLIFTVLLVEASLISSYVIRDRVIQVDQAWYYVDRFAFNPTETDNAGVAYVSLEYNINDDISILLYTWVCFIRFLSLLNMFFLISMLTKNLTAIGIGSKTHLEACSL